MIRVDDIEIPERAIAAEMQHHPAATQAQAWQQAAEALVVRQLLTAEAARRGFTEADDEEAAVGRLLDAELTLPEADEATCRRWYEANRARVRSPEHWQAAHILIAADPEEPEARRAAEATASTLLAELQADPSRLPALARAHSACPSRGQGGDLGLIEPGSTVPGFEAALRSLQPQQLHPTPVATRFGLHVLQLLRHEPGRDLPFEAVRERIATWLREASWRRAVHQYIAVLAGRARIEGFTLAGADGTLVQ
ncbi:peptidylprolyl isomerase [Siccirubricoccus sp. G192]|uniref:peptidylprolyl isomerase n=1 Tax=Siccirubricoccus sp. G192 TaxID=2849651 RepID=UPI001C2C9FC2|nr:peptidylprolyl isomerase [Siccirubricoccus sp. G192]MBV1798037.1 peptidyl-prolyl cis-trans isomerase [Siccirubricoccus sp. G192]